MSPASIHNDRSHPPPLQRAAVAALFLLALAFGGMHLWQSSQNRLATPDEKAAAAVLLEKKLSGPGYFHRTEADEHLPAGRYQAEPRITLSSAHAQVERVIAERHWDATRAEKARRLVDQLAEPSQSRAVGGPTINLLRLNLALDAL